MKVPHAMRLAGTLVVLGVLLLPGAFLPGAAAAGGAGAMDGEMMHDDTMGPSAPEAGAGMMGEAMTPAGGGMGGDAMAGGMMADEMGMGPAYWLAIGAREELAAGSPVSLAFAVLDETGPVDGSFQLVVLAREGAEVARIALKGGVGVAEVTFPSPGAYAVRAYARNGMESMAPVASGCVTVHDGMM